MIFDKYSNVNDTTLLKENQTLKEEINSLKEFIKEKYPTIEIEDKEDKYIITFYDYNNDTKYDLITIRKDVPKMINVENLKDLILTIIKPELEKW